MPILLDGIPASASHASAALRVGPDGQLYAAFDSGGDPRRVDAAASYNGKILRLNTDGRTPPDQRGGTPILASGDNGPHGLDWQPATGTLWLAGDDAAGQAWLRAVGAASTSARSAAPVNALDRPVAAIAFYRGALMPSLAGTLIVAGGRHAAITRVAFDPRDPQRVTVVDPLLRDAGGVVHALAVSPEGAIYVCAGDALIRLVAPARDR